MTLQAASAICHRPIALGHAIQGLPGTVERDGRIFCRFHTDVELLHGETICYACDQDGDEGLDARDGGGE